MSNPTLIQLPLPFDNTVIIPLTQGQFTIIDAIDADLMEFKWFAQYNSHYANGGNFVAARNLPRDKGKRHAQYLHSVILGRKLGRALLPSELVDHIRGGPLLNIRENLRLATVTQNNRNVGMRSTNTSGFKGVSWKKAMRKWVAQISVDGKKKHLGYYDTPEEADWVYRQASALYHEEFARLE